MIQALVSKIRQAYEEKSNEVGEDIMSYLERMIMLQVLDNLWKDHLLAMDHLKEGIGMRAYAQEDPLRAYKREGYDQFTGLIEHFKEETLGHLMRVKLAREETAREALAPKEQDMVMSHGEKGQQGPVRRKEKKVGRNDPCPCGSGKKYKRCCGK